MMFSLVLGQVGFESFGKFAPGQHDAPPTAFALQPDVRAEACDRPFVGTARVLFAQAKMIVKTQVG